MANGSKTRPVEGVRPDAVVVVGQIYVSAGTPDGVGVATVINGVDKGKISTVECQCSESAVCPVGYINVRTVTPDATSIICCCPVNEPHLCETGSVERVGI